MQKAEIRIEGCLDSKWADWFEGFEITYNDSGETILVGSVQDQAAIYGMMAKLRDLGVKLVSVTFNPPASRAT